MAEFVAEFACALTKKFYFSLYMVLEISLSECVSDPVVIAEVKQIKAWVQTQLCSNLGIGVEWST